MKSKHTIYHIAILLVALSAKPAIAVVGGVQGNHLLGTEMAIAFAESVATGAGTDSVKAILATTTYYIFPNMSPDAMEQYFSKLKYARQGNATATDDDRDGKNGEDEYDDLDGNGKITSMRAFWADSDMTVS